MWGGRFESGPDAIMEEINASIAFDKALFAQDLAGSRAHCRMLVSQSIIGEEDGEAILKGLDAIEAEIRDESFTFSRALEDIHMNIEARLAEMIGPAAGRLHTARSRNDQVATDFRLWVRDAVDTIDAALRDLQEAFLDRAEEHAGTIMPGFTHLQTAQPVTFGHHLMAYVEMIGRDRGRFADARDRLNECPLGAAALAGTAFPIDRYATAEALGFARPTANSLDSVSDRDFALETLAAASICALHLSRLAEEIVVWCSAPFSFVTLSDKFTTGSSIMPQKRNPDVFELVRARSATVAADLQAILAITSKMTSGYHRDLQLVKPPLFRVLDATRDTLAVMAHALPHIRFDAERTNAAMDASLYATEEAYRLVRDEGIPFRDAYRRIAKK